MTSFASLKKNRTARFQEMTEALDKMSAPVQRESDDDRFWQPTVDKAGNGYAEIRFLSAPEGETLPFVRLWEHGFQGPGGWYIEKSLTTIGEADPVSELNSELWNTKIPENQAQVRRQKRKLYYIANIYVISDPGNPENEGKVKLFKFGKKIFDHINAAMHPEFPDEQPINPFDFWDGANFKLKIRNVEGYRNYDKSSFDAPSPLFDDDAKIEAVWKQEYPLQPFLARDKFKTYEQLKARLDKVLGRGSSVPTKNVDNVKPWEDEIPASEPPAGKTAKAVSGLAKKAAVEDSEDDDDMDFFRKLASED